MKELSTFVKTVLSLTVVFSFYPHDTLRELYAYNPLTQFQEWFFQTIKPRIERNFIPEPEAFMTSVTLDYELMIIGQQLFLNFQRIDF